MTNEVVPTLAPHVNVLETIMGATLDFFYFIVGGRLGLLALCATPSRGHGYHWTLTPARGALWRRGFCSRWSRGPPFPSWRGSRGRRPRSLIIPCWGARPGPCLSRDVLGSLCHSHNRGLLLGLLLGGLLGGVFNDNRRLGRSLAGDVARINI